MRPTAEDVESVLAISVFCVAMFVICSTMENWAICSIDCPGSWEFVGSWCCSWATNSFRKPSLSSVPASCFAGLASSELIATGEVTLLVKWAGICEGFRWEGSGGAVDEPAAGEDERVLRGPGFGR